MAKYQYTVKGVDYEVEIQDIEGNIANVTVNGIPFEVEMKQPVKAGKQKVAMKMQNNIEAETSGTITGINVNKGDAVMEGDTLVTIK